MSVSAASIYSYMENIAVTDANTLYRSHWCALAVFQSLDGLSKQLLLRLLFFRSTLVAHALLEQWVRPIPRATAELTNCIDRLRRLHLIGSPPEPPPSATSSVLQSGNGDDGNRNTAQGANNTRRALDMNGLIDTTTPLVVNGFFATSLQHAISTGEATPWSLATSLLPPVRRPPSLSEIEAYAAHRWNAVLHYLIGSSDAPVPDAKVVELLVSTHLLAPGTSAETEILFDDDGNPLGLTGAGGLDAGGVDAATAAARAGQSLTYDQILELGGGAVHVTRGGYEFLLKDTAVQLWTFVDEYLRTAPARGMATSDIIAFLFELGFCRLGDGYAVGALSPTQLELLTDFMSFGLVFIPEEQPDTQLSSDSSYGTAAIADVRRFYPSSLAIILTQPEMMIARSTMNDSAATTTGDLLFAQSSRMVPAGSGALERGGATELRLVVEKNFKVYAYTRVDLHLALLALFAKIEARLPDVVVATITRKSAFAAMEKGISAAQIRRFLSSRLHPTVLAAGLEVPQNVVDQLFLWERERHRVIYRSGTLLSGWESSQLFRTVLDQLEGSVGVLIYADEAARCMIVADRHAPTVLALYEDLRRTATGRGGSRSVVGVDGEILDGVW